MSSAPPPPELKFPVSWNFRIIVEAAAEPQVSAALSAVFRRYGFEPELTPGASSKGGVYRTLATSVLEIVSRAQLEALSRELAEVSGVRVVL